MRILLSEENNPFVRPAGAPPPVESEFVPVARPIEDKSHLWGSDTPSRRRGGSEIFLAGASRRSVLLDIGWLVGGLVVAELLIVRIMKLVVGEEALTSEVLDPDLERIVNIAGIGMRAAAAMAIVALILYRRGQSCRSIGLGGTKLVPNLVVGVITPALVGCLIMAVNLTISLVWPGLVRQMAENAGRLMDLVPRLRPWEFFSLMTTVGIYEEVVFRGFLMPRLRRAMGSWTAAVLISTSIFVLLHAAEQTPAALVGIALLSLSLSVVTIWRRSLIPAIITHALYNLSVILILYVSAGDTWK